MYHPPSRRRELTKRIGVYFVMVTAVVSLVTFSVLYMVGYRFNTYENQVEQGGLVQFISQPQDAQVYVNDLLTATTTNGKLTLLPGDHTIRFARTGYHDWTADIQVVPGRITWVNYARLIPTQLTTSDALRLPSNTADTLTASNRERMALVEDDGTVQLIDLESDAPTMNLVAVPEELLRFKPDDGTPTYTTEAWGSDRYVLIKAVTKQTTRWVLVDVERPDESQQITVSDTERIKDIQLVQNGNAWYVLADSSLYYAEDNRAARLLATDVARMSVYDNETVLYTTLPEAKTGLQQVAVVHDTQTPVVLFSQAQKPPLLLAGRKYFNKDYMVVATSKDVRLFTGNLPRIQESFTDWDELISLKRPSDLRDVRFGQEGRFIMLQGKKELAMYDTEWARLYRPLPITANAKTNGWLDDYLLWNVTDDTLQLRDFTGNNVHDLAPVTAGFDVTLAQDGEVLYSIYRDETSKEDTSLYLQRTDLRVEE